MTESLRKDIEEKIAWKSDEYVKDRDAKWRISPASATNLRRILKGVCGYAEKQKGMTQIRSLQEVLVREVLDPMIDWLLARGSQGRSIRSKMHHIHALLIQHPDFNKKGHAWLLEKIARPPREARWKRSKRKNEHSLRYEKLCEVPVGLEAAIASAKGAVETAWLKHDLLFFRWTLHHPWRSRNLRECGLRRPAQVNLILEELPLDLQQALVLPDWAKRRLKRNPATPFLQFVFLEDWTKGKRMVQDLVARELIPLYEEYLRVHRPRLLGDGADPGTLFLNRELKAMSKNDVIALYGRLTEQYAESRSTPHLNRDSYAAHHLESGGSLVALQHALWHRDLKTTWLYCRRFNASHGAVALNRHLLTMMRRKG
jgi:hypothetical protein